MKAQAASNMKAQAPIKGGGPPTSVCCLRQIVARQFILLTHDPRSKHQGASCVNLSYIFLIKKMRLSFYVNLTNGGKNGIKLRLQKNRRQQLEQRGSSSCSRVLLDDDGCRNAVCYRRELERNFIPDLIFTKSWTWTMDRGPGAKGYNWMAEKAYWIWNQCWRKIQSKMAASSNQLFSFRCGKQHRVYFQRTRVAGIVSTSGPGREIAPGFLIIIMNNCDKAQASSLTRAQALGGTRPQARCAVMSH